MVSHMTSHGKSHDKSHGKSHGKSHEPDIVIFTVVLLMQAMQHSKILGVVSTHRVS